jgi:hypothetical protein
MRRSEYRIYGTDLQTERASDARVLGNNGDLFRFLDSECRVGRQRRPVQHIADREDRRFASGRAPVHFGLTRDDRFRIRAASRKTALAALRLRQQVIHSFDRIVATRPQSNGREAQHGRDDRDQRSDCECGFGHDINIEPIAVNSG